MARWDTPEGLRALLCELVRWGSVTGSAGEARFPFRLAERLRELPATEHAALHVTPADDAPNATFASALLLAPGATDTIVLVSHYDTVATIEYGELEHLACDPEPLTVEMRTRAAQFAPEVAVEAGSGEWLFGRGTADMKAGLALHLQLLERSVEQGSPVNLLLLTVSDEEVTSIGMRDAVAHLEALREAHGLHYALVLNSEPSFPFHPGDGDQNIYSGTIGKLLPCALCAGLETHVGTPLAGITSTFVAGFLAREMEWCTDFAETAHGETTPLPVTISQHDLRSGYSTQTTSRTSALFNVFVMQRTAAEVLERFEGVAQRAADRCNEAYAAICEREGVQPVGAVRVLRYDELLAHARTELGDARVEELLATTAAAAAGDLNERAMQIADALLVHCTELAPAIVLLFAPPYYPPVNSSDEPLVQACIARVTELAADRFGRELIHRHWFNGISDLSYVNLRSSAEGWAAYEANTPGFGELYDLPFAAMERLRVPVINVGPLGKDLHMRTERLHIASAFEELPVLLADLVQYVADRGASGHG